MDAAESVFTQFLADLSCQRELERETLAFEATELISRLMESESVSKAELAKRLNRSRAYVTQVLSGSRNMTMHTFADFAFALGHRVELTEAPLRVGKRQERGRTTASEHPAKQPAVVEGKYNPESVAEINTLLAA